MRRHLRNAVKDGIEQPNVVALLHGSLAGLHRSGRPLALDRLLTWAHEEGWNDEDVLILRGIALAAANATSDLGELTSTKAAAGTLQVWLTRDEARLAHGALNLTLGPPYEVPSDDYHTLTGFRSDEAAALRNAIRDQLRATSPDSRP